MAQIVEEKINIVISQIIANDGTGGSSKSLVDVDTRDALRAVAQELVGDGAVVEVFEEKNA